MSSLTGTRSTSFAGNTEGERGHVRSNDHSESARAVPVFLSPDLPVKAERGNRFPGAGPEQGRGGAGKLLGHTSGDRVHDDTPSVPGAGGDRAGRRGRLGGALQR